jgi:16S rRNA (guanine1207-N2)-methyltransferase
MTRRYRSFISPRDYHHYQERVLDIGHQQYSVITKPGIANWDEPDPAAQLLMEVMDVNSADRVVDLGCGVGWVGLVVARQVPQGWVCLVDRNAVAVEAARRTLAENGVLTAEARLSDCGAALQGQTFDLVAVHAPREREVARQCVRDAGALLRSGGCCYLAGANRSGVKSTIRYLEELFGEAHVLAYRGGSRVAVATKGDGVRIDRAASREYHRFRELIAQVRGKQYACITRPGLFSWNKMDEGSRRLVESMEIGPQERVLDLGCGYGLAGLVAADMAPRGEVVLVDVDCVAAEAARQTLAQNGVGHAEVLLSDCGAAVMDRVFDVVITNPPFHQGRGVSYEVARQFIHDAAVVLRPGGRLYLVANRFIPYGREMEGLFQEVGFVYRDNRFQVWRAIRGRDR